MHRSTTLIRQVISGERARLDVEALAGFHRIQASPGYRKAAEYVQSQLQKVGIEAWIESFPADDRSGFWTTPSFQEWNVLSASLFLAEPAESSRKLAGIEVKTSLIQRSAPFDGEAEVVYLEDGLEEKDYTGVYVSGKVVLTKGDLSRVQALAVERHNAAGILYCNLDPLSPFRDPLDLPDARKYTSFWWDGGSARRKCFGFVLTPRQGKWLIDLVRRRAREGKTPVKVRASVDSQFYDGHMEVVCAMIPGKTRDETVVVSHLCHPQPSANDNASGAAAALEAARTLHHLIQTGQLEQPQRGIRFLWLPEMTGSAAYLAAHQDLIPHMAAGIDLDMVGGSQKDNGLMMILEKPPDASASFAPDLVERINRELTRYGSKPMPGFHTETAVFSGGSDHVVFSDPTVGVPMVKMGQWPDKFYHTSADTIEHIDPKMLAYSGAMAAAFSYFTASAGQQETTRLAYDMAANFEGRVVFKLQNAVSRAWESDRTITPEWILRQADYLLDRHRAALESLKRLWSGVGMLNKSLVQRAAAFCEHQAQQAVEAAGSALTYMVKEEKLPPCIWEQQAGDIIPRRLERGYMPVIPNNRLYSLSPETKEKWPALLTSRPYNGNTISLLADFWADGKRSAFEIIDLIEMETGIRDAELVVMRFRILQEAGLVDLIKRP